MPENKDIKPVGELRPLTPTGNIKPVGELRQLNQVNPIDKAFLESSQPKPRSSDSKRIQETWGDKDEPGIASEVYQSLARGSDRLGSILAKTPSMVYDLAAQTTDALVNYGAKGINAVAGTDLKSDYQTTAKGLGEYLGAENKVAKYYDERVKKSQEIASQKYDQGITDYFSQGEYKKGFKLIANQVAESVPITISLLLANAAGVSAAGSIVGSGIGFAADKKSELDRKAPNMDEVAKNNIAIANGLFEGLFERMMGIPKLVGLTKDILKREGKEAAKKIAEEGFKDVYKPVAKKYLGVAAEESISEAATQFAQNAVDKYSGYKPDLDIMEGVVDAGIVGLAAGTGFSTGPAALEVSANKKANKEGAALKEEKIKQDAIRNAHALEIVKKGEQAVNDFKTSVGQEVEAGRLTPEQGEAALARVNAYKEYNDITQTLELNDKQRLEVFDKTWQKQVLESEIRNLGDPKDMHPLKQAEYEIKQKFANDLQKDITEILLKAQVKNETTLPNKTMEELAKKEQKELEAKQPAKLGEKKVKKSDLQKLFDEKYKVKIPTDPRTFEEVPNLEYNEQLGARQKHKITADWVAAQPNQKAYGTLAEREFNWKNKKNSVIGIKLPNGKILRFSSSMKRIYPEEGKGEGHHGHLAAHRLLPEDPNYRVGPISHISPIEERYYKDFPVGLPMGMKVYEISGKEEEDAPVKVIKGFRRDTGKFVGWMKETGTGSSNYTEKQKDELDHLQTIDEIEENPELAFPEHPKAPVAPQLKVYQQFPVKEKTSTKPVQEPEKTPILAPNGTTEENTANREESTSTTGNNNQTSERVSSSRPEKEVTLRTGTKKANRKIKDPVMIMALRHEVFTPYDLTLQHFIKGANVTYNSIKGLWRNYKSETKRRLSYISKNGSTIEGIAHNLWESNRDLKYDTSDYRDAIEEVINNFTHPKQMAQDLNRRAGKLETEEFSASEQEMSKALDPIYNERLKMDVEEQIDKAEELSNEELIKLANSSLEEKIDWEDQNDIIRDNGEEPLFQKAKLSPEETHALGQLDAAEKEMKAAKSAFDSKRKALDKGLIADQEDLFGERKSEPGGLFDERASQAGRNDSVAPLKARYDKAVSEYTKALEKYGEVKGKEDSQQSLFDQKVSGETKEDLDAIMNAIKKSFPKVKVEYDENIVDKKGNPVAGQLFKNTIKINPYYAGSDTPIHEGAHIYLDAMGENSVYKKAVEQLRSTPLWKEVKDRYGDLSEKALANEVLAEAIGREGKGIFKEVAAQNKFTQLLNYIFDWLKRNLGLEKNIAKNLARQIISGIGTKEMTGQTVREQRQRPDSFDFFREKHLDRDTDTEKETLYGINELLLKEETTSEEKEELEAIKRDVQKQIKEDRKAYSEYREEMDRLHKIELAEDLKDFTLDELTQAYNAARFYHKDSSLTQEAKERIAHFILNREIDRLKQVEPEIEKLAHKTDLPWLDIWFKSLSTMTEKFPLLQGLSTEFEKRYLQKIQGANTQKKQLEKLGKAVIKEKNKGLGIVKDVFTSDSAKYFDFIEQDGTLRTDATGLTKAQEEFLSFMQDLVKDRKKYNDDGDLIDNTLIKLDKGFQETWRTEGKLSALNTYLGGNNNLETKITYTNPETEEVETASYLEAQSKVLEYGKKHPGKALWKLITLAYKAKKHGENREFYVNKNGALTSKFDKPRPEGKGYSKDYYKAAMAFIDDLNHIKYMNELVPVVDSIEQFYKQMGLDQHSPDKFENVLQYMKDWKGDKIYQKQKVTDPVLDIGLNLLRNLASKTVMALNSDANIMNVIVGNYTNWRKESLVHILKGNARLVGGAKRAGYGVVNKKALNVLRKFNMLEEEFDSDPKVKLFGLFDALAFAGGRLGEAQIQGSQFLGHLDEKEWDSLDENGNFKDEVSEEKREEYTKSFSGYVNDVTDIHGKYSEKDRKNFLRMEYARSIFQFKLWMPEFVKSRFGAEYIDQNNKVKRGSWRFTKRMINEVKQDIKTKGHLKAFWENKQIMANVKGLLVLAVLINWHSDDKKKKRETLSIQNFVSNLLFMLDSDQRTYMLTNLSAGAGILLKLLDAIEGAIRGDEKKFKKNAKKIIPYNRVADVPAKIEKAIE